MTYGISIFAPGATTLQYRQKVWRHFLCNAAAAALVFAGQLRLLVATVAAISVVVC